MCTKCILTASTAIRSGNRKQIEIIYGAMLWYCDSSTYTFYWYLSSIIHVTPVNKLSYSQDIMEHKMNALTKTMLPISISHRDTVANCNKAKSSIYFIYIYI